MSWDAHSYFLEVELQDFPWEVTEDLLSARGLESMWMSRKDTFPVSVWS